MRAAFAFWRLALACAGLLFAAAFLGPLALTCFLAALVALLTAIPSLFVLYLSAGGIWAWADLIGKERKALHRFNA